MNLSDMNTSLPPEPAANADPTQSRRLDVHATTPTIPHDVDSDTTGRAVAIGIAGYFAAIPATLGLMAAMSVVLGV